MRSALLAYIDPGSGTLLVQAAIATVCGGLYFCRNAAWRLLTLFVRRRKNAPTHPISSYSDSLE